MILSQQLILLRIALRGLLDSTADTADVAVVEARSYAEEVLKVAGGPQKFDPSEAPMWECQGVALPDKVCYHLYINGRCTACGAKLP